VTGQRAGDQFVLDGTVRDGARPLRNEGEVNSWFSSTGFEWGYGGQGPRCLAYSIAVAYHRRRRHLARWARAEETWRPVFDLLKAQPNRGNLRLTFAEIHAAIEGLYALDLAA
jgi:hypothetical protein